MSDIDTAVVDSLKALDPKRPIREADIGKKGTLARPRAAQVGKSSLSPPSSQPTLRRPEQLSARVGSTEAPSRM